MDQENFCPQCGRQRKAGEKFCAGCGKGWQREVEAAREERADTEAGDESRLALPDPGPQEPNVPPGYRKASLLKRGWAHLIDLALILAPFAVVMLFANIIDLFVQEKNMVRNGLVMAGMVGALGWMLFYGSCHDGMNQGQSYGKRWNGLMVICLKTNAPCDMGQSNRRNLALANPLEFVIALIRKDGRRLGDLLVGTQVIDVGEYKQAERPAKEMKP